MFHPIVHLAHQAPNHEVQYPPINPKRKIHPLTAFPLGEGGFKHFYHGFIHGFIHCYVCLEGKTPSKGWKSSSPFPRARTVPALGVAALAASLRWIFPKRAARKAEKAQVPAAENGEILEDGKWRRLLEGSTKTMKHHLWQSESFTKWLLHTSDEETHIRLNITCHVWHFLTEFTINTSLPLMKPPVHFTFKNWLLETWHFRQAVNGGSIGFSSGGSISSGSSSFMGSSMAGRAPWKAVYGCTGWKSLQRALNKHCVNKRHSTSTKQTQKTGNFLQ